MNATQSSSPATAASIKFAEHIHRVVSAALDMKKQNEYLLEKIERMTKAMHDQVCNLVDYYQEQQAPIPEEQINPLPLTPSLRSQQTRIWHTQTLRTQSDTGILERKIHEYEDLIAELRAEILELKEE
jgi:hypothetical protein